MDTIYDLHESQKDNYEFVWNPGIKLIRDTYGNRDTEALNAENTIRLFTVGGYLGTRGGQTEFTFLLDENYEPTDIAETRDFGPLFDIGDAMPLWGNARVVPHSHPLYNPIKTILLALRG